MIDTAINHIASNVNQHLMRTFGLNEDVVVVSNILEQDGTVATHVNNKIVVSLVNIEKESVALNNAGQAPVSAMRRTVSNPPIYVNLYLMFASYFSGDKDTGGPTISAREIAQALDDGYQYLEFTINNAQVQKLVPSHRFSGLKPLPHSDQSVTKNTDVYG